MATTDPTPEPQYVDLTPLVVAMLRAGAKCFGAPVLTVTIVTEDGEKRTFGLPSPVEPSAPHLTRTRLRILAALRDSPVPLTRKQLGRAIGRQAGGGTFGEDVTHLLEMKLILERGGLLADDERKFPRGAV